MGNNKTVYLPQFEGESNPFDTLWYLSVEIGRSLMFKAKRIGMSIPDSVDVLMAKYNEVYSKVEVLSEAERQFLINDSYFGTGNFYNKDNEQLMEIEKESASKMSVCSQMVSEAFLKATMGAEDGHKEYIRRCYLAQLAKRYKDDFLMEVIEYLEARGEETEGIKQFIKSNFDKTPTTEDIQLMIDSKIFSGRFYTLN